MGKFLLVFGGLSASSCLASWEVGKRRKIYIDIHLYIDIHRRVSSTFYGLRRRSLRCDVIKLRHLG